MKFKPSIENSTALFEMKRKFTFGIELLVVNTGWIFALEVIDCVKGDTGGGVRFLLLLVIFVE